MEGSGFQMLYNTAFEFSTLANYWVMEEEKLRGLDTFGRRLGILF